MKIDACVRAIKVENALLATLPPTDEIDKTHYEHLLMVMENKTRFQNQYLDTDLPAVIDTIKLDWYGNRKLPADNQEQFCIPDTDYEAL